MRSVHFMLAVPIGVAGLIFLPAAKVTAENIYHWKDRNGVSCYSNTNIPGGAAELSVMFTAGTAMETPEDTDPERGGEESPDDMPAVEVHGEVSDSKAAFLKSRIEQRRSSIRYVENLLKIHPDDSDLRKCLYRKNRFLHEDLIHLGLLAQ